MIREIRRGTLYEMLKREGALVTVHDPYVADYPGVRFAPFVEEALEGADAIVIFTGHHQYNTLDPRVIRQLSGKKHPVIVDGRNIIDPDAFISQGFIYKGIGRGDKNSHPIV